MALCQIEIVVGNVLPGVAVTQRVGVTGCFYLTARSNEFHVGAIAVVFPVALGRKRGTQNRANTQIFNRLNVDVGISCYTNLFGVVLICTGNFIGQEVYGRVALNRLNIDVAFGIVNLAQWYCAECTVDAAAPNVPIAPGQAGLDTGRQPVSERSEEHTSELQSRPHLVCRLLLEKKKKYMSANIIIIFL